MAPTLETLPDIRDTAAFGHDVLQINNSMTGHSECYIAVTGGSVKGVGPLEGLEANPARVSGRPFG